MDDLVFVDTSFDQNKTKEYNLSIQVGLDGFSFSILDGKNCLALKRFQNFKQGTDADQMNSFKEILRNNELLNLEFKKVSLLWISNKSVLIPSEFFTEEFAFESFQLCHHLTQEEVLLWNKIDELGSWSVFSIPASLKEFIQSQFSGANIYHHSYPFYRTALQQSGSENHPRVFVNIQKNFFHAIIPDQNKKHFINSFAYKEDSDLAYYILNIFKQQKLNNERSKLIVDGLVQEESKVIQLLKKYLRQVEVQLLPAELRINNGLPHKEYNQFINLLNLSRCE